MSVPRACGSTAMPCLRYRDCPAAIVWLGRVFGFRERLVVPGPDGIIAHAELVLGDESTGAGMVMVGSVKPSEYDRLLKQPDETGGFGTQSTYLIVPDADLVHGRAVEAGAEIVIPLHDEDYGGRGFGCRDKEGHVWYVGTYNPWSAPVQSMSTMVSRHE